MSLQLLSCHLFTCLQGVYWNRNNWKELKPAIEQLTKIMLNIFKSVLSLSCSRDLRPRFLSVSSSKPWCKTTFAFGIFIWISIKQFSSSDAKEKYLYLQTLKLNSFPPMPMEIMLATSTSFGGYNQLLKSLILIARLWLRKWKKIFPPIIPEPWEWSYLLCLEGWPLQWSQAHQPFQVTPTM